MPPAVSDTRPLHGLLLVLSMTTGLIDAVSVLGLDKVFTANMTGNIVFLGFAAAGTAGFDIIPSLSALIAFTLGAFIAGHIGTRHGSGPLGRWLIIAALIETVLIWSAAVIALGFNPQQKLAQCAIIALTALAMGFRNGTIRQLKVPDFTTTVLTLTITGLAADSGFAGGHNPNWGRRIGSIAAIFIGAMIGAALVTHYGLAVPLVFAGFVILAASLAIAGLKRAMR